MARQNSSREFCHRFYTYFEHYQPTFPNTILEHYPNSYGKLYGKEKKLLAPKATSLHTNRLEVLAYQTYATTYGQ